MSVVLSVHRTSACRSAVVVIILTLMYMSAADSVLDDVQIAVFNSASSA